MRFEICLPCKAPPFEFVEWVKTCENVGFKTIWLADMGLTQHDVFVYLTLTALNTSSVQLGACVHHPYVRHPAVTLNGAMTLDEVSKGRTAFGLGIGGGVVAELGYKTATVATMREIVLVARRLMNGEHVSSETNPVRLQAASIPEANRRRLPIHLAATGPKMLELAGELTEGVFAHVGVDTAIIEKARAACEAGSKHRDSMLPDLVFSPFVHCSIDDDREATLRDCHAGALNVATRGARYLSLLGISQTEIEAIQANRRVNEALVDRLTLSGDVATCIKKVEKLAAGGIQSVTLYPVGANPMRLMKTIGKHLIPAFA